MMAAGVGMLWWLRFQTAMPQAARFDETLQVVIHVAAHEAKARAQPLEPLHFLYAMLQDGGVQAALRTLGADGEKIEAAISGKLDGKLRSASSSRLYADKTVALLGRTVAQRASQGESARLIELLAALIRVEPAVADVCAAGRLKPVDLLFLLVHGSAEAELRVPAGDELRVVLVNDDVTPMELVVEILEKDLAMSRDAATELMMRVHTAGRGDAGLYASGEALDRVRAANDRARRAGAPLLVQLEPA